NHKIMASVETSKSTHRVATVQNRAFSFRSDLARIAPVRIHNEDPRPLSPRLGVKDFPVVRGPNRVAKLVTVFRKQLHILAISAHLINGPLARPIRFEGNLLSIV